MSSRRIELLDAARGFCIILMILHHTAFDLVNLMNAPRWLFYSPVIVTLQYIFAGTFILISGVSSRFSRSNLRRGAKVIAAALVITLVTWFIGYPVKFGILHFLGFSMVFYGLSSRFWDRITGYKAPFIYLSLTALSALVLNMLNPAGVGWLWFLGLYTPDFYSADYFPVFPWIFVFLLGTWLGKLIKDGRMPPWFYTVKPRALPWIGRKSLLIYMVHQPVILAAVMFLKRILHI